MMASIWLLAVDVGATSVPAIAGTIDASNYLQPQGWKPYDTTSLSRSPVPDVVALVFYEKGNLVPSCGLLTASIGGKGPAFLKLVDSDPGVGFSQCLSIPAITPFKLQNKEYIVIAYLLGETRKDVDRHFHYLVRSEAQGFVIDKLLTEAVPVTTAGKGAAGSATAKPMDGVRLARLAQLRQAHPAWLMIERDFISNKFSKIFFSTLLLFSSDVFATSFDCKKAKSPVEKLICSDPKISSLDEKLARDYKSAIQSSGGNQFIAGQRKWIIEVRDKCLTSDCLINAYVVRGKWLLAHARPDESCNFSEPDLLRHWKREEEGDFEEFLLSTDGHTKYFSSWLQHRPEMMGNWMLEQCDLHIYQSGNEKISFDYKILGLSKGVLTIKDIDSDRKYRYKIIP